MKKIETSNDLQNVLESEIQIKGSKCVLSVEDNKSSIVIQYLIVDHPISFVRNIQEFSKDFNIPVSDISVNLIGFVSPENSLIESTEIFEISPYVYFRKSTDVDPDVGPGVKSEV